MSTGSTLIRPFICSYVSIAVRYCKSTIVNLLTVIDVFAPCAALVIRKTALVKLIYPVSALTSHLSNLPRHRPHATAICATSPAAYNDDRIDDNNAISKE